MTIPSGTLLKCVANTTLPGEVIAQNVFYLLLTSSAPWDEAPMTTQVGNYVDLIYDELIDDMEQNVTIDFVTINEWEWNAGLNKWETGPAVGIDNLTAAPQNTGEMLPHAVAGVITAFSEDVNARSRKSFAGFGETRQTDGLWAGGAITDLVAAGLAWTVAYAIGGGDLLIPVVPTDVGTALPFIAYLVAQIAGSQRQRKLGEGI